MNERYAQSTTRRGNVQAQITIKFLIVICLMVMTLAFESRVRGAPGPQIPPTLFSVSPRLVRTGDADIRLHFVGTPGLVYSSPSPIIFAQWNGQSLQTTAIHPNVYVASVPAQMLSVPQIVSVTLKNSYAASNTFIVTVTDVVPLPDVPTVALTADPVGLGKGIVNNISISVSGQFSNAVITDTYAFFESNAGHIDNLPVRIGADGTVSHTFEYRSFAGRTITPTVAIAAHVLSPLGYVTKIITLTGVFTHFGSYLPAVTFPWPMTMPRPSNHTPCNALPIGIATIPADSQQDYYWPQSIAVSYFETPLQVTLYELPVPATVHVRRVIQNNCNSPTGERNITFGETFSKDFPVILNGAPPMYWDTGASLTCNKYMVEVELKGFSSKAYTIGSYFVWEILRPC